MSASDEQNILLRTIDLHCQDTGKLHMLAWISPAHCHKVSYLELLAALTQISSESFTTWVGDNGRLQHRPDKRQHGVLPELFDVDRVAGP
jgi:hypothetical protein